MEEQVKNSKAVLEKGGIVIFPTETVYGVGCLLKFPQTIERLYKIKQRTKEKGTLCLFPSFEKVRDFVEVNSTFARLAKAFWPGPLTKVSKAKKSLPEVALGPGNTLGTRVPDFPFLNKLLPQLSAPLLAPSANFQGKAPPSSLAEVDKDLAKLVDYVVNIEPGGLKPSTVINLAVEPYIIIREGSLKKEEIDKVLKTGMFSKEKQK